VPTYDERTALAVVDVQNDFADLGGSLYVRTGEDVIPVANVEAREAHAAGAFVVFTQDWHPESTPHFEKDGGIWPVHCVHETWGAEFHPDLAVMGDVIRKGTGGEDGYSAFSLRDPTSGDISATVFDALLRERGVSRLVVCGLATDYCVVETAVDGRLLGYQVQVVRSGIRAVDLTPGDGDRAITRMRDAGADLV
jgi:nicotinamidase/pyrazinamidase